MSIFPVIAFIGFIILGISNPTMYPKETVTLTNPQASAIANHMASLLTPHYATGKTTIIFRHANTPLSNQLEKHLRHKGYACFTAPLTLNKKSNAVPIEMSDAYINLTYATDTVFNDTSKKIIVVEIKLDTKTAASSENTTIMGTYQLPPETAISSEETATPIYPFTIKTTQPTKKQLSFQSFKPVSNIYDDERGFLDD